MSDQNDHEVFCNIFQLSFASFLSYDDKTSWSRIEKYLVPTFDMKFILILIRSSIF